ncbi:hypothetical protein ABZP36_026872 [Zizania latifolia]
MLVPPAWLRAITAATVFAFLDVVDVLLKVAILVRRAKNRYTWIGFCGVPAALRELKERASTEMMSPSIDETSVANVSVSDDEDDDKLDDADGDAESEKLSQSIGNPSDKPDAPCCKLRSDHRKEKSLGLLTQNFVKLFLTMELKFDDCMTLPIRNKQTPENLHSGGWANKRTFGTDLTNIAPKRSKLGYTTENKAKLAQDGGSILKTLQRQLGQGSRNDFVYGPFHPAGARTQEIDHTVQEKERKSIQDWENLAASSIHNIKIKELLTRHISTAVEFFSKNYDWIYV